MTRQLFKSLLVCFCISTHGYASEDRALFWKVSSESATVYLLGSIHYADKSFYPLRKEIEQAFDVSDNLVVEVNITPGDIAQYADIMAREGTYAGGQTIKDHVSTETYEQLRQRLQQLDIPLEHVKKQKPGFLVMTLTSVQVMKMGFDPKLGIDFYFLDRAKENKKVISLETMEQQMRIFLDISDGELLLQESLHSMDDAEDLMNDMVVMWKQGDTQALHKLLFEDTLEEYPVFASIYDSLFYQRNQKMAEAIRAFLNNSDTYFVVVGAGHLIGEEGLVNLLQKDGYKVKRL